MAGPFRIKRPWPWNPAELRPEFQALASGLKLLLPMWEQGDAVNLVDRKVITQQSAVSWSTGPMGQGPTRADSATDHFRLAGYQPIASAQDHTVWGTANPATSGANGAGAGGLNHGSLFFCRRETPYTQYGLQFNTNGDGSDTNASGKLSWYLQNPTVGFGDFIEVGGLVDGGWHSFGFRRASGVHSLLYDGRIAGTVNASNAAGADDAGQVLCIGGVNVANYGFGGQFGIVAAWQRALSDREIAQLETNWLGLVERRPSRVAGLAALSQAKVLTADPGAFTLAGASSNLAVPFGATPAYAAAGAGVNGTSSGTAIAVAYPSGIVAGSPLLLQVSVRATNGAVTTPSGWLLLAGPDDSTSTTVRQWLFAKFATGSESGTLSVSWTGTTSGVVAMGRMYRFSAGNAWQTTGSNAGSGSTTTLSMPSAVATGNNRLAICGIAISNDDATASATGESGGDWTEAVAEYTTTSGSDGCLQLQTSTFNSPGGTISGGSQTIAIADPWVARTVILWTRAPMPALAGSFRLVGQEATLRKGAAPNSYTLAAGSGTFTLAGQAAGLRVDRRLNAATGTLGLTGQAAALKKGFRVAAASGSFALAGQAAGLSVGRRLAAAAGSLVLAGQPAGLIVGRRLVASAGSFTLTGQAAGTLAGRRLVAASGAFSLAGQSAGLLAARKIVAASGSFLLTGQPAGLAKLRRLIADPGSFVLSGQAASLLAGRRLPAAAGILVLTGQVAGLKRGIRLPASSGSYALDGQPAGLRAARRLAASAGIFGLSGQAAGLVRGRRLPAASGSLVLSGQPAGLLRGWRLVAGAGSFVLVGQDAALVKSTHRVLTAEAGQFILTGQPTGLLVARRLVAASGSFVLAGQSAALKRSLRLQAASGSFVLVGQGAALTASRRLQALSGGFGLLGQPAALKRSARLPAAPGAYVLAGQPAGLLVIRRLPAGSLHLALTGQDARLLRHAVLHAESAAFALIGGDVLDYGTPIDLILDLAGTYEPILSLSGSAVIEAPLAGQQDSPEAGRHDGIVRLAGKIG